MYQYVLVYIPAGYFYSIFLIKTQILFMRSKLIRLLLLCLLVCPVLIGYSQQKTIRGVLTDHKNAPVAGASVTVKGTTRGAITDATGNFAVLASPNDVLVI